MKTINFQEFPIFNGISRKEKQSGDARESFADILYMKGSGIRSKDLAFKIFKSEGAMELTEEEAKLVSFVANNFCTPAFIDSINEQLNSK